MDKNDSGKYTKPTNPLILLPAFGIIAGCIILMGLLILGRYGNKGNNQKKTAGKQEVKTEAKTKATTEDRTEATTADARKAVTEFTTAFRPAATETTELSTENTGQKKSTQLHGDGKSLSDDPADYTFLLDGEFYQLPCDFSQFTRNGWVLPSYSDKKDTDSVAAGEEVFFTFKKNNYWFVTMACNMDGKPQALRDCKIVGISIKADNCSDFTMAKGITLMSTSDEIQKAYGKPYDIRDYDEYTDFSYHTNLDNNQESIIFTLYKSANKTKYNGVFMQRIPE